MRRALAAGILLAVLLPGPALGAEEQAELKPLQVRFELPAKAATIGQTQQLMLVAEEVDRGDLLLRLPPGVELRSEGWRTAEPPLGEKGGSDGPWKLFEREIPGSSSAVGSEGGLKEPIDLAVIEEGLNWVVTVRVRWRQDGAPQRQGFSTLLATTEGDQAEFHKDPRP